MAHPLLCNQDQRMGDIVRRFSFSLDKVLDYRSQLEEQAKMALAKAQQAYQQQVSLVDSIRAEIDQAQRMLCSPTPLSSSESWLWRSYKERLLQDLEHAERTMLELAKALNDRRREAVLRSKDRKLLEKLKDKQAARHYAQEQANEQNEFDEMATLRYEHPDF